MAGEAAGSKVGEAGDTVAGSVASGEGELADGVRLLSAVDTDDGVAWISDWLSPEADDGDGMTIRIKNRIAMNRAQ